LHHEVVPPIVGKHNRDVLTPEPLPQQRALNVVGGEGFEPPAIHRGFRGVGSEAAQKAAHGCEARSARRTERLALDAFPRIGAASIAPPKPEVRQGAIVRSSTLPYCSDP
jgi:hypothetical protein